MSTNNLYKPIGAINEDSIMSTSTSNSFTDTLIQDLPKMKNVFLISKGLEPKIVDILSYLQSDTNLAINKIQIVKYLQSLFLKIEFNSEIFLRKFINDKERLNLYQIIIYQFVLYTNPSNSKAEEDSYRAELHNLFILLLSQITVDREIYRYILSFLVYFLNEKNITTAINKKINSQNNNEILDEPIMNFKSEHLSRVLELLRIFYKYLQSYTEIHNYFFFSGESDSSIIIPNKENPKDHNKKLLNLDDTLCIMLFIKVLPSEYIKAVYPKVIFRLLELRFNDKNKKNLNINIDIDNKLTTSYTNEPLYQLLDNETNCILIKFNNNKKKKIINSEIYVGLNKIELPPIVDETDKEKNSKVKDEIKEIVLFKNFIGTCSNIIIYKEKKNEGLPKFLFFPEENNSNKLRQSSKGENISDSNNKRKKSAFSTKSIFPNGIHNEELYSYFTKVELKDHVDQNILNKNIKINDEQKVNPNDFKDFLNNNLIAIYMPTRVDIHPQCEDRNLLNSSLLILRDSINNLDAEFNTRTPCLNGVHTYTTIHDDFGIIGGLNNLLPILELMTNNTDLLTQENFSLFFDTISNFVFSPLYQKAIMKENKSNFFMNLSYLLEKIPDNFFNNQLIENFKLILAFLNSGDGEDFIELNKQFHNYILINEKILFKFNKEDQKNLISTICLTAGNKKIEVDLINIIKILLYYDRKRNYKFCCKSHAEYFNENYPIIDTELPNRIQSLEKLIYIIFEKNYQLNKDKLINANNTANNIHQKKNISKNIITTEDNIYLDNNLYLLFYLLTFDISPCLQKSIICLLTELISKYSYDVFIKIFDKKEELFDIILYVFKISIFDVKIDSLNLLFLIEQNNKGKNLENKDKQIFLQNEILPIFLLDEINNLSTNLKNEKIKKHIDKDLDNKNIIDEKEKNIEEKEKKNIEEENNFEENVDINKINNEIKNEIIENKKDELENEINKDEKEKKENKVKYGIKNEIEIDGVNYYLYSVSDVQNKIYKKYNKKKYHSLLNNIYEKVISYFNDNIAEIFKLNLLIEIVSKGDLLLIQSFVSKIHQIYQSLKEQEKENKEPTSNEIIDNLNLLHFLLETSFHIYILKNQDKNSKPFIPGFSLDIYKTSNTLEQTEIPYDEKEKNNIFNDIYKKCKDILNYILSKKIQKFDYILTWSKYYIQLKKENNNYNKMNEFINEFIQEAMNGDKITTLSEQIFLNNPKAKPTLYFFNVFFEFFSYYKLDIPENKLDEDGKENQINIIKKISKKFEYVLFNQKDKIKKIDPIKELDLLETKIDNYLFIRVVFLICSPVWTGNEKKYVKNESEIYSKYILGNNKNSYLTELEILFYSFDDDYLKDKNDYCNKGTPLIILIYHLFILFLYMGGSKIELEENFKDLRLLLLLLIISSSTLNTETTKKKKWPKEEQYKDIQFIIECILFNILFFYYHRIKEFKKEINEYNLQIENINEQTGENLENIKKNLECLSILNRIYVINFGYLLKVLNKIYRGVKSEEKQKQGMLKFFKSIFKSQSEGVKNSAAFSLIEKIYKECPTLNLEEDNINNSNFRKTLNESKSNQMEVLNKSNDKEINEKNDRKKKAKNRSLRIGHKTATNLSNYLTNPSPDISPLKTKLMDEKGEDSKDIDYLAEVNSNNKDDKEVDNNIKTINNNINTNEDNYLDDISQISFTQKDAKELNLTDENFNSLENYINEVLNDINIELFYKNHYEEYNEKLYPFISYSKKRQLEIEKIIPIYDNRKNISEYPINLCLVPYYYPENEYKYILLNKIQEKNKELSKEIKLNKKKNEVEEYFKCQNYRNLKKVLFKFNGIWSYQQYFYDNETYKLKYKILNHLTNDFTRILMTPITDVEYYLPEFGLFKGNIFRTNTESPKIQITKMTDLCLGYKDKKKKNMTINNSKDTNKEKENLKNENKLEISATSFDSLNNSSTSNINEIKQEEYIPLYELNEENFPYLKDNENQEKDNANANTNEINNFNEKDYELFIDYIKKKHFNEKGENCILSEACLVKLPFHIRGIIYINNKEVGFYSYETKRVGNEEDFDTDKKVCYGSVFKKQAEKYNSFYMKIPFNEIELIFKRRYYFKKNTLEFYTQSRKSYFFRIDENKYKSFLDIMKYHLKNDLEDITIDYSKYEEKVGFINKNCRLYNYNNYYILFNTKKYSSIKFLYLKWTKWEVSTFTLLNAMNIYSNRSYNDINQYPVFPWIITDYTSKVFPNLDNNQNKTINTVNNANNNTTTNTSSQDNNVPIIRPFNTPMGMIDFIDEAKERKENYKEHWESLENDDDKDDNYDRYGSHYSTSLYLTYYLVRVFPFSYIRIELQGKNFDDPNRLFNSLSNSFECAITQKSDLRELIPEFFCFPEMFYNNNDLNLGNIEDEKTKKPIPVNDIEMPPWAKGDAYIFVKKHRELLESVEISEKINEWFNIIFGSKQKGKAAKIIGNLFIRQTYEDFDEVHKNAEPGEKTYQKRMVEFGVTPSQLFKNDTYKRYAVKDLKKKPILYNFQIKTGKKEDMWNNTNEELEIKDSEIFLEGNPYKIFSSLKKNEDVKNEKILFLYEDKIKIISKTNEKGFFKKNKNKENKTNKNKQDIKNKENKGNTKDIKDTKKEAEENKDSKEQKEIKENEESRITENKEIKENEENNKSNDKVNNESDNEENNSEEENEIKDEEDNKASNKETISKYDKILISPKYRMNHSLSPTIIYDKGNYIAQGGFWNGNILINRLEDLGNKKDKSQKNINIISTNELYPITHIKIDLSETFVICANKIGMVYVFIINQTNKSKWTLHKVIQDNQREITSVDLNENLNIFITCDKDGYNNLYTLPTCKLFNSYKLNENVFNNTNTNTNSRSISNLNVYNILNNIYADHATIFNSPLPSIIFYIKSRKSLCVFSINFHFIKEIELGYEIVPNGIKKYSDYFSKDYLFIYNKNKKTIDVYDLIDLDVNLITRSAEINYNFVDFHFSKEMDHALILVKIDEDKKSENIKEKNEPRNYKILVLSSPGRGDVKIF